MVSNANLNDHLLAKCYYSGFNLAHDTYNAIAKASDGRIYYVLSFSIPMRVMHSTPIAIEKILGNCIESGERRERGPDARHPGG